MQFVFMTLLLLTAVFLILLVLVQRGRGGGLTGALGGMGGQSAFGSKAGDLFTRITIGVAAFWIILSVSAIKVLNTPETVFGETDQTSFEDSTIPSLTTDAPEASPSDTGTTPPADDSGLVPDTSVESDAATSETTDEAAAPATAPAESTPAATESTEAAPAAETSEENGE